MFLFGQCSPRWLYPFFWMAQVSRSAHGNHAVHDRFHGQKSNQKRFHNLTLPIGQFGRSLETAHAHFDAQIFLGLFTLRDDEVPQLDALPPAGFINHESSWFPRLSHGSLWRMMRLNPPADTWWYFFLFGMCWDCEHPQPWMGIWSFTFFGGATNGKEPSPVKDSKTGQW